MFKKNQTKKRCPWRPLRERLPLWFDFLFCALFEFLLGKYREIRRKAEMSRQLCERKVRQTKVDTSWLWLRDKVISLRLDSTTLKGFITGPLYTWPECLIRSGKNKTKKTFFGGYASYRRQKKGPNVSERSRAKHKKVKSYKLLFFFLPFLRPCLSLFRSPTSIKYKKKKWSLRLLLYSTQSLLIVKKK